MAERPGDDGDPRYVLVCSEGRLNAFSILGETHIPALVVDVSDEDAFIMSLAENIARRGYRPTRDQIKRSTSSYSVVRTYQREVERQRKMVLKAEHAHQRLLPADVTRIPRNMKAARQVEAVGLMIASNTITVAHAEALLKASLPEQRTDVKPAEREKKTAPIEQIEKLEK